MRSPLHWAKGAILGLALYGLLAVVSSPIASWDAQCRAEFYRMHPGSLLEPCLPTAVYFLLLTLLRGPSLFIWSSLPTPFGYVLSALVLALAGSLAFRLVGPRRGSIAVVITYVLLLAPAYLFALALGSG